jgi:hypothetical protein
MSLTDAKIRNTKPADKPIKLKDVNARFTLSQNTEAPHFPC